MEKSKTTVFVVGSLDWLVRLRQLAGRYEGMEYIGMIGSQDTWFVQSSVVPAFQDMARACNCTVLFAPKLDANGCFL